MVLLVALALLAAAPWTGARQLVLVTTPSWTATTGTLRRYARADPAAAWVAVGAPVPVVVGKKGLGWRGPDAPRDLVPGPTSARATRARPPAPSA